MKRNTLVGHEGDIHTVEHGDMKFRGTTEAMAVQFSFTMEELALWKDLARHLDDLCVAYRLGRSPAEKTLDAINKLKKELHFDGYDLGTRKKNP